MLKKVTTNVKTNPIGALAGAGLTFWAAKKYANVSGTWKLVGLAALGAIAGAYVQGQIAAKSSTPKASDIKK
jgi:hypothetical protein